MFVGSCTNVNLSVRICGNIRPMKLISALVCAALLFSSSAFSQTSPDKTYELRGGWWFNGQRFVRRKLYVVKGVFTNARPARVDEVLEFGDSYVVPPFADAHMHGFDNPAAVAANAETYLREGIFYAMSLANSIRGRKAAAALVNHPGSVDVATRTQCLLQRVGTRLTAAGCRRRISSDSCEKECALRSAAISL